MKNSRGEETNQGKTNNKKYYCEKYINSLYGIPKHQINQIQLGLAHLFGIIGLYKLYTFQFPILIPFTFVYGYIGAAGATIGAHRYWSHKSFKAKLPLRIILAFSQTVAGQHSIFNWCRDHRVHHKYVDTESDPYNSTKGFWHAHIGWAFLPSPPGFKEKLNTIDLSDVDNDPIVRFQAKYYWYLALLCCMVIPMTIIKCLVPEISWFDLYCLNYAWYLHQVHFILLINSAAHMWGYRPYNKEIHPRENKLVSYLALGEDVTARFLLLHNVFRWHNYHHTFPYDYKAAELGVYRHNWGAMIIDFFAWIGWAYDLKSIPSNVVKDRVKRTGDGSHAIYGSNTKSEDNGPVKHVWGWGDEDMTEEDYKLAEVYKPNPAA